ncbi:MAG: outer membrane protein [Bradyrhizobium sp.]|nr:outer membrane protein [Bradyrhizobium sp.]
MSRVGLGALVLLAAGCSMQAQAADFYNSRPPYTVNQPLNAYSWAGPYLGGNVGYAWGSVDNVWAKPGGFAGGVQGGFNWQERTSPWVFGIEADIQGSSADDRFAAWKFSNPWFGTVRGRGGYAFNNLLVYGTLGLALGELRATTFGLTESHTNVGWTAGVGAEYGFAPNWSAKIEYLYVDLASSNFVTTGASHGLSFGTIRAGVNYRFSAQ